MASSFYLASNSYCIMRNILDKNMEVHKYEKIITGIQRWKMVNLYIPSSSTYNCSAYYDRNYEPSNIVWMWHCGIFGSNYV